MSDAFNGLNHADAELFALLAEECGETVQAISKILRHGQHSWNPDVAGSRTNIENLEKEIGDIQAAVELLSKAKVIDVDIVDGFKHAKLTRIAKYLHYNAPLLARSKP